MQCNTLEFSYSWRIPQNDFDAIRTLLERRGAFFTRRHSYYKNGVHVEGLVMNIPVELPWEPFLKTLKESGVVMDIANTMVERNVIRVHRG